MYNCQRWIENQRGRKLQTILGESHTAKLFKNSNDKVGQQIHSFKGIEKKKKEREKFLSTKEESLPSD